MKLKWSELKSRRLKMIRGVSFEEIVQCPIVGFEDYATDENQKIILFNRAGYIWGAPCVMGEQEAFLKTLYPSHKFTQRYMRGDYEKN